MIYCIMGSRTLTEDETVKAITDNDVFKDASHIIIGSDSEGGDMYAKLWAESKNIPVIQFHLHEDTLEAVKIRNKVVAEYLAQTNGKLLAIVKGISLGTRDMIQMANEFGVNIAIVEYL